MVKIREKPRLRVRDRCGCDPYKEQLIQWHKFDRLRSSLTGISRDCERDMHMPLTMWRQSGACRVVAEWCNVPDACFENKTAGIQTNIAATPMPSACATLVAFLLAFQVLVLHR